MTKIVYNACFGGFSLSREAVLLGRKISGNPKWGGATIEGDIYDGGSICKWDHGYLNDTSRTDSTLIAVVEQLGDKANGRHAELAIAEVPAGTKYRIDEYDGRESVCTKDDYDWQTA